MDKGKNKQKDLLTLKIVVIGDKSVGKTSLVRRYTENHFSFMTESTIGTQFASKILEVEPMQMLAEDQDPPRVKL